MRMVPRRRLALAIAALAGGRTATASADEARPTVRLEFEAPAGCPDATRFAEKLARRGASVDPAAPSETSALLRVEIQSTARGVVGRLVLQKPDGETSNRSLEAADCVQAADALALIAALALGDRANTEAPSPLPPLPASAPVSASSDRPPPVASAPRASWSFSGEAAGFVGWGMAPDLAPGWSILAGFAVSGRSLLGGPLVRIGVGSTLRQSFFFAGGTASFGLVAAIAEVCPLSFHLYAGGVVRPCLVGEFGALHAEGSDTVNPRSVTRPWSGAGVEGRISVRLFGPLSIDASVAVLLRFDRDQFEIGGDTVFSTPPSFGRALVGIGVQAP